MDVAEVHDMDFYATGKCWRKFHQHKDLLTEQVDMNFLIGLNDDAAWVMSEMKHPVFTYFAGAEFTSME